MTRCYGKRHQRTRQRLIAFICSKYYYRDCLPMLQGYRARLETFDTSDLRSIREFLKRKTTGLGVPL